MEKYLSKVNFKAFNDNFIDTFDLDLLTKSELIELSKTLDKKKNKIDILVIEDEFVGNSYNNIELLQNKCKIFLKNK